MDGLEQRTQNRLKYAEVWNDTAAPSEQEGVGYEWVPQKWVEGRKLFIWGKNLSLYTTAHHVQNVFQFQIY